MPVSVSGKTPGPHGRSYEESRDNTCENQADPLLLLPQKLGLPSMYSIVKSKEGDKDLYPSEVQMISIQTSFDTLL